jgi:sialate O-acetylesterase
MIAPLVPYAIRGAIWYQGESNAGHAHQYRTLLPALIADWRNAWGQGDFPFLIVQLANFGHSTPEPGESTWAELREAQLMTLATPNAGMAVAVDIGDSANVHPKNKKEVGRRLSLAALAIVYGGKVEYSGPVYRSMTVRDGKAHLAFDHADGGLVVSDGEALKNFAVAGADGKFRWARAAIESDGVAVWHESIPSPTMVRYNWADNPYGNLANRAGLPASPFRTDDLPGITVGNK